MSTWQLQEAERQIQRRAKVRLERWSTRHYGAWRASGRTGFTRRLRAAGATQAPVSRVHAALPHGRRRA